MKFNAFIKAMPKAWLPPKFLLVMKMTSLLFLIALVQVSAKSFSQKISLDENNASLEKVLHSIEKQSGYVFFYNTKAIGDQVTVHVNNASIDDVLKECFKNTDLTYKIADKTIFLQQKELGLLDKIRDILPGSIHIKGVITDTTGKPIAGATVQLFIKTNKQEYKAVAAYTSPENGLFNIDAVAEGDRIVISYIGYQTYTITVTKNMPVQNIALRLIYSQLTEVIIQTGYQTLSKERATGSFSKPDMQTFANRSSTMDLLARLEGQSPGFTIINNAITGNTNINTFDRANPALAAVRGQTSVQSNSQPLFVVDGIITPDFSVVNNDNVADITVLKDAAAAAIYGAQAANGVIVVITKTGSRNQKLKVAYNGFVAFNGKPDFENVRKHYVTSAQYVDIAKQTFNPTLFPYSSYNTFFNGTVVNPVAQALYDQAAGSITLGRRDAILDSLSGIDNTKEIENDLYRNAYTINHTLSVSGGTNTYTVYASMGYTNLRTSDLGQNSNSYKLELNQTFTPNNRFSFSLSTQLADNVSVTGNPISFDSSILPFLLFKDANGNGTNMPYLMALSPSIIKQYSASSGIDLNTYSPITDVDYAHSNINSYAVNLVGNATVKIWNGIKYIGTFGYATTPTATSYLQDYRAYGFRKTLLSYTVAGTPPTYLIPANKDYYQTQNNNQINWTVRNQLAYDYSGRNGNDQVTVQAGQEARDLHQSSQSNTLYGYDPQLLSFITPPYGTSVTTIGGSSFYNTPFAFTDLESRYLSYFALGSYTLDHKYSVDLSWRKDNSSLFGSDISAQNKPAYSIGGKWNIRNEKFMPALPWLNDLAIRGTYGVTGNSPRTTGGGTQLDALRAEQFLAYTALAGPALTVTNAGDKDLSWEATHTTNLGIDFSVLNSRLNGSIEYYYKDTKDLIGSAPVNIFTGFTSSSANLGELTNNGINITLNSTNIATEHFTWQSGFIFAHNTNKLVSYSPPTSTGTFLYLTGSPTLAGYPLNSVFAYKWAGLSSTGDAQIYLANGTKSSTATTTPADLVYMGTNTPKFSGGFSNSFRYDQFQLTVNLSYSLGGVMRNTVNQSYYGNIIAKSASLNPGGDINVDFLNRWQKPGDENITNIPRYTTAFSNSYTFYQNADINVLSASYIKMNDAALIYNISPSALRWLKIQSASVRAQVNNLMLWTANKQGIDPQTQTYFAGNFPIPAARGTITIGANVNF
jgi:TonB-linked SusC/RagA family outer membrane protein